MIFNDEVDLIIYLATDRLRLTLTNQNQPAPSRADLATVVVEILDHHCNAHACKHLVPVKDRLIEFDAAATDGGAALAAACCIHVAETFQQTYVPLGALEATLLLLAAIVKDTA